MGVFRNIDRESVGLSGENGIVELAIADDIRADSQIDGLGAPFSDARATVKGLHGGVLGGDTPWSSVRLPSKVRPDFPGGGIFGVGLGMTGRALGCCLDLCENNDKQWGATALGNMCAAIRNPVTRMLCWKSIDGHPVVCQGACRFLPNPSNWPPAGGCGTGQPGG